MASVRFDFSGEHVLVTGASRGIGYGVAEAFASSGADLTILADDAGVDKAAETLSRAGGRDVRALQCDITDRNAVRAALADVERIDVLVNNAGLERITPLLDESGEAETTFRRIVDVNVMGTYHVTREATPKMAQGGRMVFTASVWSRVAVAEFSAYCASKHATLGFMRSMARELGPRGIRVNAVCPGWVRTEASMLSLRNMSERTGLDEDSLLGEIIGAQVFGGLMDPDDIAQLYLFLASDAASNITGQAVVIDRGEVMA
ncbi:MAG: SDR family NAD(P)-dependent oxidoreductase [Hyphomicrobiales bacterium]